MSQTSKADVVNIQKSNELPANTTFSLPEIKSPSSNTNLNEINEISGNKYNPKPLDPQEEQDKERFIAAK